MQTFRQQHWFIQPELCGMESLRLESGSDLDPRYSHMQPFVEGSGV